MKIFLSGGLIVERNTTGKPAKPIPAVEPDSPAVAEQDSPKPKRRGRPRKEKTAD